MYSVNQLTGFGAKQDTACTFGSIASSAGNFDNNGWNTSPMTTIRQYIASSALSASGGSQIRITFRAATSGGGFNLVKAWVGARNMAGEKLDFDGNQAQLQFGGNDGILIAANTEEVSDSSAFTLPSSTDLIISYGVNGASTDDIRSRITQANWEGWYQFSIDDVATENVTQSNYTQDSRDMIGVVNVELCS